MAHTLKEDLFVDDQGTKAVPADTKGAGRLYAAGQQISEATARYFGILPPAEGEAPTPADKPKGKAE